VFAGGELMPRADSSTQAFRRARRHGLFRVARKLWAVNLMVLQAFEDFANALLRPYDSHPGCEREQSPLLVRRGPP
jgi:hypothetical protein